MKLKLLILSVMILALLAVPVMAADESPGGEAAAAADACEPYADALYAIGLFRGTEIGYELDRCATREEAITMIVRMLGAEDEALSGTWEHPFTDAPTWADGYIGYAYEYGITNGISKTEFGAGQFIDRNQYAALMLRTLGYSDDVGGQFHYARAYEFACHKFAMEPSDDVFDRGEMVRMTYAALNTPYYNTPKTLAKDLMSQRVFTQTEFSRAKAKLPREEMTTAVLIYAVASDLESKLGMLSADIKEILDAPTDNIEILMQTGGTKNYRNTQLHDKKTQRLTITDDALTDITVLEDADMCERQTLEDFLVYARENVIADRYVMIFWDHGEGTLGGFGMDELNNNASMSIADMKTALAVFGRKFDLLVFDACLMGTAECAYAFADAAEYLIASEDTTPTEGIYYTTWLNSLSVAPTLPTEELARLIVDSYIIYSPAGRTDVTMSVIRTANAAELADALSGMLYQLTDRGLTSELTSAGLKPYGYQEGCDQYDILTVFRAVDMDVSGIAAALESAVYYRRSAVVGRYSGMAVYLPLVRHEDYSAVKEILAAIGYPAEAIAALDKINEEIGG